MLTLPVVGVLNFIIIMFKSQQGRIGLFKICVKPQQLVILAQQTAVYMSNSSVAYKHERLTWRAELSVQVLNMVCTQTKIGSILYLQKKGVCFLFLSHVHNTHRTHAKGQILFISQGCSHHRLRILLQGVNGRGILIRD